MKRSFAFFTFAVGLAVGCGTGMSDTKTPGDPMAYQQLAMDASSKVESHRSQGNAAGTVDACNTEHMRYEGEVRTMLEKLQSLSAGMDSCMMQMGKAGDADMANTCSAMMAELGRHKTAACVSDVTANKAEAVRHCDAMKTWLDSLKARATYLSGGMGSMSSCK
jgi:hypothetical protein